MRKTDTRNRTELAVLAVTEGLLPARPGQIDSPTVEASSIGQIA